MTLKPSKNSSFQKRIVHRSHKVHKGLSPFPPPVFDGRNCPFAKTAKKSGFRHPTFFCKMTSKRSKSVLGVGNPIQMPLKTPISVPFWKLVLVHLEDIKGEKGHFPPHSRAFCRFNESCVRQNHLEFLPPVAFPSSRHTFKGNPATTRPGFLCGLVFPMGFSTTCHPRSSTGCQVPDSECYGIGFLTQK